jgi:DNA-binding response OmpR family regulator
MKKEVLLVEDFQVMQEFYMDTLKDAGYAVDIASDGSEALEKVTKKRYDFILLDMLLPKVNGIEFLEKYKGHNEGSTILVLSDFTEPGRIHRALELGAAEYLIKAEYPPSKLVEKLDSLSGVTKEEAQRPEENAK